MKFISYIILAILALCALLSDARPLRQERSHQARDKVDVIYYQYDNSKCSGKVRGQDKETGDCIRPTFDKVEKIESVNGNTLTVTSRRNSCNGRVEKTMTFEKNKCTKDDVTGYYVKWDWD